MKIITFIIIGFIKLYRVFIRPIFPNSCRFEPTCSQYCIDSLKTFGLIKGSFMSVRRILSCHPIKFLGGGEGFDPVNKKVKFKK